MPPASFPVSFVRRAEQAPGHASVSVITYSHTVITVYPGELWL